MSKYGRRPLIQIVVIFGSNNRVAPLSFSPSSPHHLLILQVRRYSEGVAEAFLKSGVDVVVLFTTFLRLAPPYSPCLSHLCRSSFISMTRPVVSIPLAEVSHHSCFSSLFLFPDVQISLLTRCQAWLSNLKPIFWLFWEIRTCATRLSIQRGRESCWKWRSHSFNRHYPPPPAPSTHLPLVLS